MRRHHRWHGRHAPPNWRFWRMRWRLQRRIFVWFGAAILFTGAIVATVVMLTGAPGWRRDWNAMQSFAGERFERVWDDPPAREELARSMHRSLHADVALEDASGHSIGG